jgi:N-acylneuraminate cytidylyltransferase
MSEISFGEVLAVIPVRGRDVESDGSPVMLEGRPLIAFTIEAALKSSTVSRTIVTTDAQSVRDLAISLGAEAPFLRPAELAQADVTLDQVLQQCVAWLDENENYSPELVLCLEVSHPIRPEGLLEQVVEALVSQQLDTVFTVYEERGAFWNVDEYGELARVGTDDDRPSAMVNPIYREIAGLAMARRTEVVRKGDRYGSRIGIVPLRESYALVDTQTSLGVTLAKYLLAQEDEIDRV